MQLKVILFNSKSDFSTGYLVEYNVYLFFTVFLLLSPRGCYIWSKGRSQLIFQRLPITDQTDTINWTASRPHLTKIFSRFCGLCLAISWPTIKTATTISSLTSAGVVLERSWSTIKPVLCIFLLTSAVFVLSSSWPTIGRVTTFLGTYFRGLRPKQEADQQSNVLRVFCYRTELLSTNKKRTL